MGDEKNRPNEEKETPTPGPEKEEEKNNNPESDVEVEKADDKADEGDDGKKEDEGEDKRSPYDKKIDELEKDNDRKSTALAEKNKKISDLKKELEESGLSEEQIDKLVTEKVEAQLGEFKKDSQEIKELKGILHDQAVNNAIKEQSNNPGEAKIIKFFFDKKVNKELSFNEQVSQAVALARNEMSDPEFQKEVEKANQTYSDKTGKRMEDLPISEGAKQFADLILKTDKGKEVFAKKLGQSK